MQRILRGAALLATLLLILVRSWDPKAGRLVGHLAMHNASLTLRYIDSRKPPANLVVGEAVKAQLREKNIVEIKGRFFLIETITLEGSNK